MRLRLSPVQIFGAGPAGTLLALLLAQRGVRVRLFERNADPRQAAPIAGRSINLALAARGLQALDAAGLRASLTAQLLPMVGRWVHEGSAAAHLQRYGQADHEVIYSISRRRLSIELLHAAAVRPEIELRFSQRLLGISPATQTIQMQDTLSGHGYELGLATSIVTDGAGSAGRRSLAAGGWVESSEALLDHRYKELSLPAQDGRFALDPIGLHIWPRGGFMLIALPNTDNSFTATLFLPALGAAPSFASLSDADAVNEFFQREFPDAASLMPQLTQEFSAHPVGVMGTVHTSRWNVDGRLLLLGDAAHAIVPFHGQGVNCAFEDCRVLCEELDRGGGWADAFATFERRRRDDVAAIAQMALENYQEMRAGVSDAHYLASRALALRLERLHPGRIVPRYSMVMFHPELGYAQAQRRGAAQQALVDEIMRAGPPERLSDAELAAHPGVMRLLAELPHL